MGHCGETICARCAYVPEALAFAMRFVAARKNVYVRAARAWRLRYIAPEV
jgi:hypothetical protein